MNTANFDIQDHSAQPGVPAGQGVVEGNELPYQPEALARKKQNYASRATADPEAKCLAPGVPRLMYMPHPFQIVQGSRKVFMQFEYAFHTRTIFTGRQLASQGRARTLARRFARPLGRRHAGRRRRRFQRSDLVRPRRELPQRCAARDRALYAQGSRSHRLRSDDRGSRRYSRRPWKMRMIFYRHLEENFRVLEYLCWAFPLEKVLPVSLDRPVGGGRSDPRWAESKEASPPSRRWPWR